MKKKMIRVLVIALAAMTLTGCSSPKSRKAESSYRQKGIDYMTTGDYVKAAATFQNALDEASRVGDMEIDICLYRAEALYLSGDSNGAMEVYNALIDYNNYTDAYYLRGKLNFAVGDYESGMADFQAAMDARKDDCELMLGICDTLNKYGQTEDMETILNKVIEMKGSGASVCMNKGRAYFLMGDLETAESNLKQAVDKGETEANFYLAQVYAASGENDLADHYFQVYVDSGKGNAENLMLMGEACARGGDYETALKYFLAAGKLNTATVAQELMKDTIVAYEYTGDFDSAEELMEQYFEEYPKDYDAEKELTFLKTRISGTGAEEGTEGETEIEAETETETPTAAQ